MTKDNELLAAYAEGKVSEKERSTERQYLEENPDMVINHILPESEKEYDRMMTMNTIKLTKKTSRDLTQKDTKIKDARLANVEDEQSPYTEDEKQAITTLILKLLCSDSRILPVELTARGQLYNHFHITYQHEQNLLPIDEAINIYKIMCQEKRDAVRKALNELALADEVVAEREKSFIEELEK